MPELEEHNMPEEEPVLIHQDTDELAPNEESRVPSMGPLERPQPAMTK